MEQHQTDVEVFHKFGQLGWSSRRTSASFKSLKSSFLAVMSLLRVLGHRVAVIQDHPNSITVKQLHAFIGVVNF
jgi:hypothetical protein